MKNRNFDDWLFKLSFKMLVLWLSCHVFVMVNTHYVTKGLGWFFIIPVVAFTYAVKIQLRRRHFI